jgi:hypothetical protein
MSELRIRDTSTPRSGCISVAIGMTVDAEDHSLAKTKRFCQFDLDMARKQVSGNNFATIEFCPIKW